MKLKQIIAVSTAAISLLGLGFWVGNASAGTADPGTAADPLVSKSYVDQAIANLVGKDYVDQALAGAATKSYVDNAMALLNDHSYVDQAVAKLADKSYVDSKTLYSVVNVPQGATLLGESGTEFVLRGGKATAVVTAKGGLLDATDGVDLGQGMAIKPNHQMIIPVSDGRGMLATADAILIVKGTYTVKPAGQ